MSKKSIDNFNINGVVSNMTKSSVFDRIIGEINTKEIPPKYVEQVLVQFCDGNVIELTSDDFIKPIPLNLGIHWSRLGESLGKLKDIKVFINITALEKDINEKVEEYLGHLC